MRSKYSIKYSIQLIVIINSIHYNKLQAASQINYCDMIKSKTIQNDTSISQIYFAIAPFQISFNSPLTQTLIIYLQKGLQIIGSLRNPLLANNQTNISIPFNDNILQFRIFYDKNTQYQWSIYKRLEDDSQELIQTQKFSLKDIWKTVNQNRNLQQNKQRSFTQTQHFSHLKMNLSFYIFAAQSQQLINDQIMIKLNPQAYQNSTEKPTQVNTRRLSKRTSLLKSDSIKSDKKNAKSNIQTVQKVKQITQNKSYKSLITENQITQEKNIEKETSQNRNIVQRNTGSEQKKEQINQNCEQNNCEQKKGLINLNNQQVGQILKQQPSSKDILIQSQVKEQKQVQKQVQKGRYQIKQKQEEVVPQNLISQMENKSEKKINQRQDQPTIQTQQQDQQKCQNPIQIQTTEPTISLQGSSEVLEARSKKIAIIFLIILIIIGFGGYQFLPKSLKKKELKGVNKFKKNRK